MTKVAPLSPAEETLWRAIMRLVKSLPRDLDSDLIHGTGLSASDYTTLMHLSEASNRELRMSDLASTTGLSASRMTRLVDDLQTRGPVTKMVSSTDARGNVAKSTPGAWRNCAPRGPYTWTASGRTFSITSTLPCSRRWRPPCLAWPITSRAANRFVDPQRGSP